MNMKWQKPLWHKKTWCREAWSRKTTGDIMWWPFLTKLATGKSYNFVWVVTSKLFTAGRTGAPSTLHYYWAIQLSRWTKIVPDMSALQCFLGHWQSRTIQTWPNQSVCTYLFLHLHTHSGSEFPSSSSKVENNRKIMQEGPMGALERKST